MPTAPFLGAGLGRMASGISEGLVQGPLMERMIQRQDTQDQQKQQLTDEQVKVAKQTRQKGFVEGALNFYKTTGDADKTKELFNKHAPDYDLPLIEEFTPMSTSKAKVVMGGKDRTMPYLVDLSDPQKPVIRQFETPEGEKFVPPASQPSEYQQDLQEHRRTMRGLAEARERRAGLEKTPNEITLRNHKSGLLRERSVVERSDLPRDKKKQYLDQIDGMIGEADALLQKHYPGTPKDKPGAAPSQDQEKQAMINELKTRGYTDDQLRQKGLIE
jgi:hypothetical protein